MPPKFAARTQSAAMSAAVPGVAQAIMSCATLSIFTSLPQAKAKFLSMAGEPSDTARDTA